MREWERYISDLTTNLIKGYFLDYTEKFALKYVAEDKRNNFPVDKVKFNYNTESFIFYFSHDEYIKTKKVLEEKGKDEKIGESIFLIDCRNDNKLSASNL